METKPTTVDPANSKRVRFTDNSAKEGDFYPEDQVAKPLFLSPDGSPYSLNDELGKEPLGDGARDDG